MHECQTQAKPPLTAGVRTIDLVEQIEHVRQTLGRNTDSGIFDSYHNGITRSFDIEPNISQIRSIFGSIVKKIHKDLGEPKSIAVDKNGILRHGHSQFMLP